MRYFIGILVFIAATTAGATYATAGSDRDVMRQISKCAEIAAATERLTCFDAAASQVQTALSVPEAPVATVEEEGGVLAWFGLEGGPSGPSAPSKPEDFGKPPAPAARAEGVTFINAKVLEFAKNALGRSLLVLDNGQIWKQIEGDTSEMRGPREGEIMQVTIEKGMLGSYNLTVEGRNSRIRVRRVK